MTGSPRNELGYVRGSITRFLYSKWNHYHHRDKLSWVHPFATKSSVFSSSFRLELEKNGTQQRSGRNLCEELEPSAFLAMGCFDIDLDRFRERSILPKFWVLGLIDFPTHHNIKDMCFLQNYNGPPENAHGT